MNSEQTKEVRRVVAWGGMDEMCQCCDKPAVLRFRGRDGDVFASACREHSEMVRKSVCDWSTSLSGKTYRDFANL